jgi:hypothetical protein
MRTKSEIKKHNCGAGLESGDSTRKKISKKKIVCEMELRAIVKPPVVKDLGINAD